MPSRPQRYAYSHNSARQLGGGVVVAATTTTTSTLVASTTSTAPLSSETTTIVFPPRITALVSTMSIDTLTSTSSSSKPALTASVTSDISSPITSPTLTTTLAIIPATTTSLISIPVASLTPSPSPVLVVTTDLTPLAITEIAYSLTPATTMTTSSIVAFPILTPTVSTTLDALSVSTMEPLSLITSQTSTTTLITITTASTTDIVSMSSPVTSSIFTSTTTVTILTISSMTTSTILSTTSTGFVATSGSRTTPPSTLSVSIRSTSSTMSSSNAPLLLPTSTTVIASTLSATTNTDTLFQPSVLSVALSPTVLTTTTSSTVPLMRTDMPLEQTTLVNTASSTAKSTIIILTPLVNVESIVTPPTDSSTSTSISSSDGTMASSSLSLISSTPLIPQSTNIGIANSTTLATVPGTRPISTTSSSGTSAFLNPVPASVLTSDASSASPSPTMTSIGLIITSTYSDGSTTARATVDPVPLPVTTTSTTTSSPELGDSPATASSSALIMISGTSPLLDAMTSTAGSVQSTTLTTLAMVDFITIPSASTTFFENQPITNDGTANPSTLTTTIDLTPTSSPVVLTSNLRTTSDTNIDAPALPTLFTMTRGSYPITSATSEISTVSTLSDTRSTFATSPNTAGVTATPSTLSIADSSTQAADVVTSSASINTPDSTSVLDNRVTSSQIASITTSELVQTLSTTTDTFTISSTISTAEPSRSDTSIDLSVLSLSPSSPSKTSMLMAASKSSIRVTPTLTLPTTVVSLDTVSSYLTASALETTSMVSSSTEPVPTSSKPLQSTFSVDFPPYTSMPSSASATAELLSTSILLTSTSASSSETTSDINSDLAINLTASMASSTNSSTTTLEINLISTSSSSTETISISSIPTEPLFTSVGISPMNVANVSSTTATTAFTNSSTSGGGVPVTSAISTSTLSLSSSSPLAVTSSTTSNESPSAISMQHLPTTELLSPVYMSPPLSDPVSSSSTPVTSNTHDTSTFMMNNPMFVSVSRSISGNEITSTSSSSVNLISATASSQSSGESVVSYTETSTVTSSLTISPTHIATSDAHTASSSLLQPTLSSTTLTASSLELMFTRSTNQPETPTESINGMSITATATTTSMTYLQTTTGIMMSLSSDSGPLDYTSAFTTQIALAPSITSDLTSITSSGSLTPPIAATGFTIDTAPTSSLASSSTSSSLTVTTEIISLTSFKTLVSLILSSTFALSSEASTVSTILAVLGDPNTASAVESGPSSSPAPSFPSTASHTGSPAASSETLALSQSSSNLDAISITYSLSSSLVTLSTFSQEYAVTGSGTPDTISPIVNAESTSGLISQASSTIGVTEATSITSDSLASLSEASGVLQSALNTMNFTTILGSSIADDPPTPSTSVTMSPVFTQALSIVDNQTTLTIQASVSSSNSAPELASTVQNYGTSPTAQAAQPSSLVITSVPDDTTAIQIDLQTTVMTTTPLYSTALITSQSTAMITIESTNTAAMTLETTLLSLVTTGPLTTSFRIDTSVSASTLLSTDVESPMVIDTLTASRDTFIQNPPSSGVIASGILIASSVTSTAGSSFLVSEPTSLTAPPSMESSASTSIATIDLVISTLIESVNKTVDAFDSTGGLTLVLSTTPTLDTLMLPQATSSSILLGTLKAPNSAALSSTSVPPVPVASATSITTTPTYVSILPLVTEDGTSLTTDVVLSTAVVSSNTVLITQTAIIPSSFSSTDLTSSVTFLESLFTSDIPNIPPTSSTDYLNSLSGTPNTTSPGVVTLNDIASPTVVSVESASSLAQTYTSSTQLPLDTTMSVIEPLSIALSSSTVGPMDQFSAVVSLAASAISVVIETITDGLSISQTTPTHASQETKLQLTVNSTSVGNSQPLSEMLGLPSSTSVAVASPSASSTLDVPFLSSTTIALSGPVLSTTISTISTTPARISTLTLPATSMNAPIITTTPSYITAITNALPTPVSSLVVTSQPPPDLPSLSTNLLPTTKEDTVPIPSSIVTDISLPSDSMISLSGLALVSSIFSFMQTPDLTPTIPILSSVDSNPLSTTILPTVPAQTTLPTILTPSTIELLSSQIITEILPLTRVPETTISIELSSIAFTSLDISQSVAEIPSLLTTQVVEFSPIPTTVTNPQSESIIGIVSSAVDSLVDITTSLDQPLATSTALSIPNIITSEATFSLASQTFSLTSQLQSSLIVLPFSTSDVLTTVDIPVPSLATPTTSLIVPASTSLSTFVDSLLISTPIPTPSDMVSSFVVEVGSLSTFLSSAAISLVNEQTSASNFFTTSPPYITTPTLELPSSPMTTVPLYVSTLPTMLTYPVLSTSDIPEVSLLSSSSPQPSFISSDTLAIMTATSVLVESSITGTVAIPASIVSDSLASGGTSYSNTTSYVSANTIPVATIVSSGLAAANSVASLEGLSSYRSVDTASIIDMLSQGSDTTVPMTTDITSLLELSTASSFISTTSTVSELVTSTFLTGSTPILNTDNTTMSIVLSPTLDPGSTTPSLSTSSLRSESSVAPEVSETAITTTPLDSLLHQSTTNLGSPRSARLDSSTRPETSSELVSSTVETILTGINNSSSNSLTSDMITTLSSTPAPNDGPATSTYTGISYLSTLNEFEVSASSSTQASHLTSPFSTMIPATEVNDLSIITGTFATTTTTSTSQSLLLSSLSFYTSTTPVLNSALSTLTSDSAESAASTAGPVALSDTTNVFASSTKDLAGGTGTSIGYFSSVSYSFSSEEVVTFTSLSRTSIVQASYTTQTSNQQPPITNTTPDMSTLTESQTTSKATPSTASLSLTSNVTPSTTSSFSSDEVGPPGDGSTLLVTRSTLSFTATKFSTETTHSDTTEYGSELSIETTSSKTSAYSPSSLSNTVGSSTLSKPNITSHDPSASSTIGDSASAVNTSTMPSVSNAIPSLVTENAKTTASIAAELTMATATDTTMSPIHTILTSSSKVATSVRSRPSFVAVDSSVTSTSRPASTPSAQATLPINTLASFTFGMANSGTGLMPSISNITTLSVMTSGMHSTTPSTGALDSNESTSGSFSGIHDPGGVTVAGTTKMLTARPTRVFNTTLSTSSSCFPRPPAQELLCDPSFSNLATYQHGVNFTTSCWTFKGFASVGYRDQEVSAMFYPQPRYTSIIQQSLTDMRLSSNYSLVYHFSVPAWPNGDLCQLSVQLGSQPVDSLDIKSSTETIGSLRSRRVTFMPRAKTGDLSFQLRCDYVHTCVGDVPSMIVLDDISLRDVTCSEVKSV